MGGSAEDAVHATYKSGSTLRLHAILRDGYGNVVNITQNTCTPEFWLEDTGTPSGASRATLAGDVLTFGDGTGAFSAAVRCREHPEINSQRNSAPFQFETNNGAFAHEAHVAEPAAAAQASSGPSPWGLLVGLAVGGAVAYFVYELAASDAGGSCSMPDPCVCSYGGANCTNLGTSYCVAQYGLGSCVSQYPQCTCDSGGGVSRTVESLVASGLRESRANYSPAPVSRTTIGRTAPTAHASTPQVARSSSFIDSAGKVLLLGGFATALAAIISNAHVELQPWIGASSSGLGATFRF